MNEELKDVYIKKLSKALSMEETIIKHLPKMVSAATNGDLKAGLAEHLEETRAQRDRLVEILGTQGGSTGDVDKAFVMMMENAGKEVEELDAGEVRDALIIAAAQTVEHVEIARYGTLIEWAKQLEDDDAVRLLKDTLSEEEAADKKLTAVAEGGIFTTGVNELAARK